MSQPQVPTLVFGDFNCRIGNNGIIPLEMIEGTSLLENRQSQDKVCNEKGNLLLDFMSESNFFVLNGRMVGDESGSFTFLVPRALLQSTCIGASLHA